MRHSRSILGFETNGAPGDGRQPRSEGYTPKRPVSFSTSRWRNARRRPRRRARRGVRPGTRRSQAGSSAVSSLKGPNSAQPGRTACSSRVQSGVVWPISRSLDIPWLWSCLRDVRRHRARAPVVVMATKQVEALLARPGRRRQAPQVLRRRGVHRRVILRLARNAKSQRRPRPKIRSRSSAPVADGRTTRRKGSLHSRRPAMGRPRHPGPALVQEMDPTLGVFNVPDPEDQVAPVASHAAPHRRGHLVPDHLWRLALLLASIRALRGRQLPVPYPADRLIGVPDGARGAASSSVLGMVLGQGCTAWSSGLIVGVRLRSGWRACLPPDLLPGMCQCCSTSWILLTSRLAATVTPLGSREAATGGHLAPARRRPRTEIPCSPLWRS